MFLTFIHEVISFLGQGFPWNVDSSSASKKTFSFQRNHRSISIFTKPSHLTLFSAAETSPKLQMLEFNMLAGPAEVVCSYGLQQEYLRRHNYMPQQVILYSNCLAGAGNLPFPTMSRLALRSIQLPTYMTVSPGVSSQKCNDPSPPSNLSTENVWNYTFTPQ